MSKEAAVLRDPYTELRRVLLNPEEVRELSQLSPRRSVRDTALIWLQILLTWAVVYTWTEWWVVLLAIPLIGTRHYALHLIGHDGVHRRLFPDARMNDLFNDLFIYGPEGAVTHLNGQNHLLHHRLLSNESDPDRHKYISSNKSTAVEFLIFLSGLASLGLLWRNVFMRQSTEDRSPEYAGARSTGGYTSRDVAILVGWQIVLIGGLSWTIGWWAYPVLWALPVYVFTYCGDLIRFFLEHSHAESDVTADDRRLISYTSNRLERAFFAPMNMNFHAVHHLWPSIPYYNLRRADARVRSMPGAERLIWRRSYLGALWRYFRALPLPQEQPAGH